ncbi:MAG: diguanylate cyclase (GGDEF)-like protein [Gammaproteobacteria bacterium]|jgi:diguanylate cyclase (GGDEF)-like protein
MTITVKELPVQPRVKILLAYLFILSLGLAISVTIFITGRQVTSVTTTLIEEKLPRLQIINELYLAIIERERLLYEYYATTDSTKILSQLTELDHRFSAYFHQIELAFPNSEAISNIRYGDGMVRELTQQLDNNLQQPQVDWDSARAQLVELTETGRRILPALESLVAQVNQEAFQSGEDTRASTELSTRLVISFSIFVIIIAAFVGYYVNSYITETINRRRLAMFAERSPNPILSFNWLGQLSYSNPACFKLMEQQGNHSKRVESLLPDCFQDNILKLQKSNSNYSQWISEISDNCILEYSLSLLRDLDTCHLYLEDITERTQAQARLKHEAYHDALTDLPNRRYFYEHLNELVANNHSSPFALMLIHIDRFDLVTSSAGFQTGDLLMQTVAKQLQVFCQGYCSVDLGNKLYRLDSNKFSLLLDKLPEHKFSEKLAIELRQNLSHSICIEGKEFYLTLSIGISHYPSQGSEGETLLANADAALTRIKTDGGDGILCYSQDIQDKEQAWIIIERDLRTAIDKQQLELFYQPKIQAFQHQICGVEALIRWRKEDGKMISPFEFIPVAEQTGLIITIGNWVIEQSFKQLKDWQNIFAKQGSLKLLESFSIAVNLSAKQFQHPDFISNIKQHLLKAEIEAKFIELEITESLLINDIEQSIQIMHQLKDIGFKLSIDDFGTGYSSLSYLKQFPIDTLKIDRAFVMDIENNDDDKVLAKSIIDLAHNLNLTIIAEGVENQQQLAIIEELGAEEIQGFYFSKPKPSIDIETEYFKKSKIIIADS